MGMRVVYQGTMASPPDSYFSIKMADNYGNVFLNSSSSGKDIYFTYKTQQISGEEEIVINIVDLVGQADDITGGVTFYYVIDTDQPEPPLDIEARADSDIDTLMGYDDDPDVWLLWPAAKDGSSNVIGYMYNTYDAGGTSDGTFVDRTKFEFKGLRPGWNSIYIWSVDEALNYGPAASVSVYYDVDGPMFMTPTPAPASWVNTNTVKYEITIADGGGSGVDGRTIEYAISNDGGRTFGAWEPTNIKRVGDQITIKLFINFREGQDNYIKWRAKDVAGNGHVESEAFQVKVDTIVLTYKDATPQEPQDSNYVVCGITIDDIRGSGVDGASIQYSISLNGVSNYGPWETLELGGVHESIMVSTPPLYFDRDTVNYIKWRSRDIAGNGWIYSSDLPIEIKQVARNTDPVPIITSPQPNQDFDTGSYVRFDGSTSEDSDGDALEYLWISDIDGYLGTEAVITRQLSAGNHRITLAVSDGKSNISLSLPLKVFLSIPNLDTDNDGIVDLVDDDDDNDGLLDIEEDKNRNGLIDEGETNPRNPDTDGDGYSDSKDFAPLDDSVTVEEGNDLLPGWLLLLIIMGIVALFIMIGIVFLLIQVTDRKRRSARRELRKTRRNLRRFEVLTGVPTNDLPAIEAVQWALPGVIAEASEFILEAPATDDLLPPSPDEEEKPLTPEVSKPSLEDLEVPAPVAPTVEDDQAPEPPKADTGAGSKVITCSLCGSEVPVSEGVSSVECPLCGEIIKL